ncbi:MAG: inorganic phosphate transporter [Armatimonadota bacterium]
MPDLVTMLLISVVVLAITFDFINGFHDSANAIATSVVTRALSMRNAIIMAAILNFGGAMAWTGVAKTIGKDIVDPHMVVGIHGQTLVLSALVGAIIWNLLTWWKGLPSSSSHALIGSLIGTAIAAGGVGVLKLHGIGMVFLVLIASPILGFIAGTVLMLIVMNIFAQQAPAKLNKGFKIAQIVSAGSMAFTHGSNDAQKSMGIITMALIVAKQQTAFEVQDWVKISCALAMAFGSAAGGWKIIKTVGKKVIGWQPVHGFASETAASLVVLFSTLIHMPVSTTHVISSAIMGVGATKRLSAVRWGIVRQIVGAWLLTLPVSALLGAICYMALSRIIG